MADPFSAVAADEIPLNSLTLDPVTLLSLASTLAILLTAYTLTRSLLPSSQTPTTHRLLFTWHAFDALIHFILEGSYLWNCFFSYTEVPKAPSAFLPPGIHFLGREERLYGAEYGSNPMAALWREYSKADKRWAGSDLTVISLELLTVLVAGPLGVYICYLLARTASTSLSKRARARDEGKAWFWMTLLATGEIYGGWMTFAPEWLSGSVNLETRGWVGLWVYLVFFNSLWVWIPGLVLIGAYGKLVGAMERGASDTEAKKRR